MSKPNRTKQNCAGAVTIISLLSFQNGDGPGDLENMYAYFSRIEGIRHYMKWLVCSTYPWNVCVMYDTKITDIYLTNAMFRNRYNESNGQRCVIVTARRRVLRVIYTDRNDSNCSKMIVTAKAWCCVNIRDALYIYIYGVHHGGGLVGGGGLGGGWVGWGGGGCWMIILSLLRCFIHIPHKWSDY